ncbi:hypothetical protein DFH27DRAFT_524363 [Peziza echinospora]|nr:hypothetical protein DFH27DRAFT_524363 [Peziza echinospora]
MVIFSPLIFLLLCASSSAQTASDFLLAAIRIKNVNILSLENISKVNPLDPSFTPSLIITPLGNIANVINEGTASLQPGALYSHADSQKIINALQTGDFRAKGVADLLLHFSELPIVGEIFTPAVPYAINITKAYQGFASKAIFRIPGEFEKQFYDYFEDTSLLWSRVISFMDRY